MKEGGEGGGGGHITRVFCSETNNYSFSCWNANNYSFSCSCCSCSSGLRDYMYA
jgi:hypothetical protein